MWREGRRTSGTKQTDDSMLRELPADCLYLCRKCNSSVGVLYPFSVWFTLINRLNENDSTWEAKNTRRDFKGVLPVLWCKHSQIQYSSTAPAVGYASWQVCLCVQVRADMLVVVQGSCCSYWSILSQRSQCSLVWIYAIFPKQNELLLWFEHGPLLGVYSKGRDMTVSVSCSNLYGAWV